MFTADYKNTFDSLKQVLPSAKEDIGRDANGLFTYCTLTCENKGYSFVFWYFAYNTLNVIGEQKDVDGLFFCGLDEEADKDTEKLSFFGDDNKKQVIFIYSSNSVDSNLEEKKKINVYFPKNSVLLEGNKENLKIKIFDFFDEIIEKNKKKSNGEKIIN